MSDASKPKLQAGGTINSTKHVYIVRPTDDELLDYLLGGEYCNVLCPRQMGKSSLMIRTQACLVERGVRVAEVDMAMLSSGPVPATVENWYLRMLQEIARKLNLAVDVRSWWDARQEASPNQRLLQFFLEEVARLDAPVVVFLDEIDATLKLPYADGFFVALRSMYNERAQEGGFTRLTFCLLGVATANELIKDRRTTPYNIGKLVELGDFDPERDDLRKLYQAVVEDESAGERLVKEVLRWTGGHPFLTLYACSELARKQRTSPGEVEQAMAEMFSSLEALRVEPHFEQVLRFIDQRMEDKRSALELYRRIWGGKKEVDRNTPLHNQLKLTGLVKRDRQGQLVVRNPLYQKLFTDAWVQAVIPLKPKLQAGGTLNSTQHVYIARPADDELLDYLLRGEYCNVLCPRQMGKSSLVIRTQACLVERGVRVAEVDMAMLSSGPVPATMDEWYFRILHVIARRLNPAVDVRSWWDARQEASPNQRLLQFFLEEVARLDAPVVVFLDEIDATLKLPYADGFFVALRSMYNERAQEGGFTRLTFCLLGVATANELIKDRRTTPYSIGKLVELGDFDPERDDLRKLYQAVVEDESAGERLVKEVLRWTGGHPFLTLYACSELARKQRTSPGEVEQAMAEMFSSLEALRGDPHFAQVQRFIDQRMGDKRSVLELYRRIWGGKKEVDRNTPLHNQLKLTGLVKRDRQGQLVVRNPLYQKLFTDAWVQAVIPPEPQTRWGTGRVATAAGVAGILLSLAIGFCVLYPDSLLQRLEQASEDYVPAWNTYQLLRDLPFREEQADEAWARFLERKALGAERREARDAALLWRLKALRANPTDARRKSVMALIGEDYRRLLATARRAGEEPAREGMPHLEALAVSADGQRVVTAGDGDSARIWDARTGLPVGEPLRHELSVRAVAISTDGLRVVTGSDDDTAQVWDARTGQKLGGPLRHGDDVVAVAFSADGQRVVTGSLDGTAQVWRTETGQPVGPPLSHQRFVMAVALSPDGQQVVTASEGTTAQIWDAQTGQKVGPPLPHKRSVRAVAFSPEGQRVVTGSGDTTAQVWDVRTGQKVGPPLRHEAAVRAVAFSPEGQRVVTASDDTTAQVWSAETGQSLGPLLRHQRAVRAVAFSLDGQRVVTGSDDDTARVWDTQTGQVGQREENFVRAAAISPDGQRVVVARSRDTTAQVWNAETGQPVGPPLRHQEVVRAVAFGPGGQRVVTGSEDNTAQVWDAQSGQPVGPLLHHGDDVVAVALSPDGQRVVTGSNDDTAQVWDAQTGQSIGPRLRHRGNVVTVAFSPDGQRVVTGSDDDTAQVWDAQTGQPVGAPLRHEQSVVTVSFSADGQRVATGSLDRTARVWRVETGKAAGPPLRYESFVWAVAFSPNDEQTIAATWKWLHLSRGDRPLWSELLPGRLPIGQTIRFLDATGNTLQVAVSTPESIIHLVKLQDGGMANGLSVEGDPAQLIAEWERLLWLRIDESGQTVSLHEQ
ncbi:AAA-like domain-containing protein [Hyalangium versicolor]|uniref:AAA-like domain-containing protein n=1 Tax=Hyalangium versicolor TaxID=2861190 RepID=UPI001CCEAFE3|nr:AAA-like domain-containing protein [Hyalangium versicolor]